jgi:hypothetical protein
MKLEQIKRLLINFCNQIKVSFKVKHDYQADGDKN